MVFRLRLPVVRRLLEEWVELASLEQSYFRYHDDDNDQIDSAST